MQISGRPLPPGTRVTMYGEPVLGQAGLEALSPKVGSIIARWSLLEKQLDQIHTLVTDDAPDSRADFDALKGWDRRFEAIAKAAQVRLPHEVADRVKAVLRLTEEPARKRHELAHGLWAVAAGYENCLTLLAPKSQHGMGKVIVEAKKAGTTRIPMETTSIYEDSRIVSGEDLDQLIAELEQAKNRMEQLLYGYLYPEFADATGKGFQDYREQLADDREVSARLTLMDRERKRRQKSARRIQSVASAGSGD